LPADPTICSGWSDEPCLSQDMGAFCVAAPDSSKDVPSLPPSPDLDLLRLLRVPSSCGGIAMLVLVLVLLLGLRLLQSGRSRRHVEGGGALCWSTKTDPSSCATTADAFSAAVDAEVVVVDVGVPSHDVAAAMVSTIMERIAKGSLRVLACFFLLRRLSWLAFRVLALVSSWLVALGL